MYLEDHSYSEIIETLNRKGFRTRRGQLFAKNSLTNILKNERYTGVYIYVKDTRKNPTGKYCRYGEYDSDAVIRIPGGMPAIISEGDFEDVQRKMKERQHKAAKFSAKQEYLLSGKIYCGECGSPFAGNSRKPRPAHPLYVSYKCTRRNQRIKTCKNTEINREKLERIVLDKLSAVLFNDKVIPSLVEEYNRYIAEKQGSAHDRVAALEAELREVNRKISNAVNVMIDMGSSALKAKLIELEETRENLEYQLEEAKAQMTLRLYTEEEVSRLFCKAEEQLKQGTLANRRLIIDRYVNKVMIYRDKIEIYLNLMPDYVVKEVVKEK